MSFANFINNAGLTSHEWQEKAYEFCFENETNEESYLGLKGGLIADEMGLGKTIVMVGLMSCNNLSSTLIILPNALVEQWNSQITSLYSKAGINKTVLIVHGTNVHKISEKKIDTADIVLTTYGTMSSMNSIISQRFTFKKWDRIIYDEAHHMRNSSTKTYECAIALNSDITWLLSGTPINNKVRDFWNIMKIVGVPKKFDTKDAENVRKLLANFVIKRTKKSVGLKIPDVVIHNISAPWLSEPERMMAYNINALINQCDPEDPECAEIPEQYYKLVSGDKIKLALMVKAKQSCICPKIIADNLTSVIADDGVTHSKITCVTNTIIANNNGRKKLVFCHFNDEINIINNILSDTYKVGIINGSVTGDERHNLVTSTSIDVLILQIQSCCEGLNLQQYSEIYFTSPSWNPSVEDQAIARAHRVGQTQTVDVYRFIMEAFNEKNGNIEHYSKIVQENKREIATNMYNDM